MFILRYTMTLIKKIKEWINHLWTLDAITLMFPGMLEKNCFFIACLYCCCYGAWHHRRIRHKCRYYVCKQLCIVVFIIILRWLECSLISLFISLQVFSYPFGIVFFSYLFLSTDNISFNYISSYAVINFFPGV